MSTFIRFRFWKPMVFLLAVLVAAVAVLQVNPARPAQALGFSAVSVTPNTMGATAQISFQVTNQSANNADQIRVDFPANTFGVPETIAATAITVPGQTVQFVAVGPIIGGKQVTIFLAPGIPTVGNATVTFTPAAGITNPTVPGNYILTVSTEEEPTPLVSAGIPIVGQVQDLAVTLTPSVASAMDVSVLATLRVATNTVTGATVNVAFPAEPSGAAPNEFTVPTTITPAQVQVGAGATAAEAANAAPLSPGGVAVTDGDNIVTVSLTLPSGVDVDGTPNLVEAGRFISVRFLSAADIDNPTSPGTFPLTVSTSVDTAAAQSSVSLGTSAQADLAVTKSDAPDPVTPGSNLVYTVTVTNIGPAQATNVTVTDTLPAGATFLSPAGTGWTCSVSGLVLTCTRPSLAVGAAPPITITVTVPSTVGILSNFVTVGATESDPNTNNNTALATTAVQAVSAQAADLQVLKVGSPDRVQVGQQVTYTITVNNQGPDAASAVTLTDLPVGGFTLVSAVSTQGSCSGTSPITCALGTLANGASANVTIIVTAQVPDMLINIAAVFSGTPDPRITNNVAQEKTEVRRLPEALSFGKIEFRGTVQEIPPGGHAGAWKIQGLTVQVTESTEVKHNVQVGSFVKVEGHLTGDGVVQAKEISAKKLDKQRDHKKDKGNRPGHGKGDRNHKHSGPPGHDDDDD